MISAEDVYEISRTVLGDRDGLVCVLKVYMDESGVHGGSPVVTVAAYAARPSEWKKFTKAWKAKKAPISVYHATDSQNLRGEFEGWSAEQRDEYVKRLLPVMANFNLIGVAACIDLRAYEDAVKANPGIEGVIGTPYGACFHWVVQTIIEQMDRAGISSRIGFVHESNDNQKEALDCIDWIKRHPDINRSGRIVSLTFGGKGDYVPLQAADILAYEANKRIRDTSRPTRRALQAINPNEDRLSIMYYNESNIDFLVDTLRQAATKISELRASAEGG